MIMFKLYQGIIDEYKKLPLRQERKLIILAKKGVIEARDELLLHLMGFFVIRIQALAFPSIIKSYGDDLIQQCLILATEKIETYNLKYRNKTGELQPLHLSTYMWKNVTGLIYTYGKNKEICFSDLSDSTIRKI